RELEVALEGAGASHVRDMEEQLAQAESLLWSLHEALESGQPSLVRGVFLKMVGAVVLHFDHVPLGPEVSALRKPGKKRRVACRLVRGDIYPPETTGSPQRVFADTASGS